MSKYHINKHGVPAPCHAKEGNCPLGGNDTHFDSAEDAQNYADKINEDEHSLLPNIEPKELINQGDIDLSNESYDALFHEYSGVGVHIVDLNEIVDNPGSVDEEDQAAHEEMYYEISESSLSHLLGKDSYTLIPENKVKDYFLYDIVNRNSDYGETNGYDGMADTVESVYPEKVTEDSHGRKVISDDVREEIAEFATNKLLSESGLRIFREPAVVGTYDDRNWAKEYFENEGLI